MQIIRHFSNTPASAKNCVIALGNFDGIHLGHKEVIKRAVALAKENDLPSAIMTFEPHPLSLFKPDIEPFRITPLREKFRLVEKLGIDFIFTIRFDYNFSLITAEEFIEKILVGYVSAKHIVIGYDFIFGHQRGGNAELLRSLSGKYGYKLTQVKEVTEKDGNICSSTKIRDYIRRGNIKAADKILGHDYVISGRVRKGEQRGRELGFHTANIKLKNHIRPAFGVYSANVCVERKWYDAVLNIGKRPTFDGNEELLEVHLFDFSDDLYGKNLQIKLKKHIRSEIKFDNIEELKTQIEKDFIVAKEFFKNKEEG